MKVALVGFGKSGQALLPTLLDDNDISRVHIYEVDNIPNDFRNSRVVVRNQLFDFSESYDLLVICTPDDTHFNLLYEAVNLGIDTFVEKPAVISMSELISMEDLLVRNQRGRFSTNTVLRCAPFIQEMKGAISSGLFGDVLFFEGKYIYGRWRKILEGWRGKIQDYSVILGGGIHLIDLVCFLVGDFSAVSHNHRFKTHQDAYTHTKDAAVTRLEFSAGHRANISSIFASPTQHYRTLACYGPRAWFETNGDEIRMFQEVIGAFSTASLSWSVNKGSLLKEFLQAKKGGWSQTISSNLPTEEEVLKVVRMCL